MSANTWPRETASVTAWSTKRSKFWRSPSERDGISRFLAGFQHAQFAALLDAVVDMAPEAQKILRGGHQRADHHQPEQKEGQEIQRGMPRSSDEHSYGAYLENHLGLAEHGRFDGEAFGGGDVAQAKHGEFASDDDDHHPGGNQVHVHQGNESGGDEELVGDGVEQDAEGGDLQAAAREVAVGPIGRGGEQENGHAENFEVHVKAPQLDVGAAGQKYDDENGNEKNPQQRECIRKIHQGLALEKPHFALSNEPRLTIDLACAGVNGSKSARKRRETGTL